MRTFAAIIQWLLAILAGLLTLLRLSAVFLSQEYLPFLIFTLAFVAVFPPLQPLWEKFAPWFRFRALKIFLCVVLLTISVATISNNSVNLQEVKLCPQLQEEVCTEDVTVFSQDTDQIYLSAGVENFPQDTNLDLTLSYIPEPDKKREVTKETKKVETNNQVTLELNPEQLLVGTYEVYLTAEVKNFIEEKKVFTVWESATIEAREEQELLSSGVKITKIELCDGSENQGECQTDSSEFASQMTDLVADIDIANAGEGPNITVICNYLSLENQGKIEVSRGEKKLRDNIDYFIYNLSYPEGFKPGKYELITYLGVEKARPIRREFTVE